MLLLDLSTYLGHLHPLMVHLPIGFLLLAVIFQVISYKDSFLPLRNTVPFILLLGFLSAVLSCVFGYLLAGTGEYDYYLLTRHRNSGIALAVVSGLLWMCTLPFMKARFSFPGRIFSLTLIALAGLMAYSGHQGAGLTHGSDYLKLQLLTQHKRVPPTNVDEAMIFEDVVQPILDAKCGSCHQGGKRKGGLSMQSLQTLLKGGKTGPAVVAGHLTESELYRRITLNPTEEKFMPSDGKPPLTPTETEILRWWIEKAMAVEGQKLSSIKENDKIKPLIAFQLGLGEAPVAATNTSSSSGAVNPEIPEKMEEGAIEGLRKKGWVVRVLLQKPVMLDVTLPAGSNVSFPTLSTELTKVAKNIIWLNLSANNLTDKDLGFLPMLSNLEKLRLEKNPLTDGIFDLLPNLRHLEVINLNETRITASGMDKLKNNASIKRVYCWGTAVGDSTGVVVRK